MFIIAWVQKLFGSEDCSHNFSTTRFDDLADHEIAILEKALRDFVKYQATTVEAQGFNSDYLVNDEERCKNTYILFREVSETLNNRLKRS